MGVEMRLGLMVITLINELEFADDGLDRLSFFLSLFFVCSPLFLLRLCLLRFAFVIVAVIIIVVYAYYRLLSCLSLLLLVVVYIVYAAFVAFVLSSLPLSSVLLLRRLPSSSTAR